MAPLVLFTNLDFSKQEIIFSKKSKEQLFGRTSQNTVVIFPRINRHIGETIHVKILSASSAALIGEVVE